MHSKDLNIMWNINGVQLILFVNYIFLFVNKKFVFLFLFSSLSN